MTAPASLTPERGVCAKSVAEEYQRCDNERGECCQELRASELFVSMNISLCWDSSIGSDLAQFKFYFNWRNTRRYSTHSCPGGGVPVMAVMSAARNSSSTTPVVGRVVHSAPVAPSVLPSILALTETFALLPSIGCTSTVIV